ncbi:hypothetical protein B5S33_g3006 [[Candida] boidinii]|nr:hypothetical protein B5S30_g4752 [[Candida] boidinii]OWB84363.1 hypothetical protein B5S33_g3006 [[Candida] boidinii]
MGFHVAAAPDADAAEDKNCRPRDQTRDDALAGQDAGSIGYLWYLFVKVSYGSRGESEAGLVFTEYQYEPQIKLTIN